MSSYSEIAAKGPKQSDAEKAANAVPELVDHAAEASTTVDAGQQINIVDSGFKERDVKTETQAKGRELAQEAEDNAKRAEAKVKDEAHKAKDGAKKAGRKAENALIKAGQDDRTYQVLNAVLFASVGFAGYQRFQAGRLEWTTVGASALGLGLLVTMEGAIQRWFEKQ